MPRLFLFCVSMLVATTLSAFGQGLTNESDLVFKESDTDSAEDPDFEKLMGKWIVRSVVMDGELTPAQIGQKEGDIISIVPRDDRAFFS